MGWKQMKDKVKEELKATKCMRCEEQSELFSENYEKFYCKKHMLEHEHTDCNIHIQDLDELLDSDLEILKDYLTSFYLSLSTFTDGSNRDKLSGVNIDHVQDPIVGSNTLMDKLDINENLEEEKAVTIKQLSYCLLEKLCNLKKFLRIIKGNQGTNFIEYKSVLL